MGGPERSKEERGTRVSDGGEKPGARNLGGAFPRAGASAASEGSLRDPRGSAGVPYPEGQFSHPSAFIS